MTRQGYGQFCPIAMASEVLATRWTILVVAEMQSGSTRFNEIRKGVPRMSPALLSKRLKELESAGIVRRLEGGTITEYRLTEAGLDLAPIVTALGDWAMRWIDKDCTLANLDAQLLMWNMRRRIDPTPLPLRRTVIQFVYPELPAGRRSYWLIVSPGTGADLCMIDPGFDVDVFVHADLRAMTSAWMGMSRFEDEIKAERIRLTGDPAIVRSFSGWLRKCTFAVEADRREEPTQAVPA